MGKLDVQLIVHPDCKITAIDDNSYLRLPGNYSALKQSLKDYTSVEFLKYKDEFIARDALRIENYKANRDNYNSDTIFPIYKDGIYFYYKMLIPTLDFLFIESNKFGANNYYTEICLLNQTFYHKGNFYLYLGDKDIVFDDIMSKESALSKYESLIINNSKTLSHDELYENLGSQSFSCKKIVFTICNLIKCFVSLQRKTVAKLSANVCYDNSDEAKQRDFLLSTIYVLDYLKDLDNFCEAQRILDNINECNMICENNDNNDCGCYGG